MPAGDAYNRQMTIRRAEPRDTEVLGRLGAALMRTHYDFDRQRFLEPHQGAEQGYGHFLRSQMDDEDCAVCVAEVKGRVVGYVYAAVEPLSWKDLRGECGFIHDLLVDPSERGEGIGGALLEHAITWLRQRGMPRVVLSTAAQNAGAQRLFANRGFRPTMIEMTLEV
jgi:GNAT superfamily N-acetyltransferase